MHFLGLLFASLLLTPIKSANAAPLAHVPGGSYLPFYTLGASKNAVRVKAFALDVYPVSNADYLSFVKTWPKWRRSQIKSLFADKSYLRHWQSDLAFEPSLAKSPVVNVSWFTGQAYCQAQGKQLPTLNQWEFAAQANEQQSDASQDPAFSRRILAWYGQPSVARLPSVGKFRNVYGIYDLHGLVWEWVRDFQSIMLTSESREDSGINRDLFCASAASIGSNPSDYAAYMRFALRASLEAHYSVQNLGFRCAKE